MAPPKLDQLILLIVISCVHRSKGSDSSTVVQAAKDVLEPTTVTRDFHGDIFTVPSENCVRDRAPSGGEPGPRCGPWAAPLPGHDCRCQCAPSNHVFRDDIHECVKEITDCPLISFVRPFIQEKIPVISLPTTGQLIHPGAHLQLTGSGKAYEPFHNTCEVYSTAIMTQSGWQLLDEDQPIFELTATPVPGGHHQQGQPTHRTFLRWLGGDSVRRKLQQRLVLIHFACDPRDPGHDDHIDYATPCAAVRIGWPVPTSGGGPSATGRAITGVKGNKTDRQNYLIIGLSLGVLGLMYVLALMIYLRTKSVQKRASGHRNGSVSSSKSSGTSPPTQTSCVDQRQEEEGFSDGTAGSLESTDQLTGDYGNQPLFKVGHQHQGHHPTVDKSQPVIIQRPRHGGGIESEPQTKLENHSNSSMPLNQHSAARNGQSDGGKSAPHSGQAIAGGADDPGTTGTGQTGSPRIINPILFEPEYLAEPPAPAVEFLKRIRDMMAAARGRLLNFRFKPTLLVIPEDDYHYQQQEQIHQIQHFQHHDQFDTAEQPVAPPRPTRSRRTSTPMVGRRLEAKSNPISADHQHHVLVESRRQQQQQQRSLAVDDPPAKLDQLPTNGGNYGRNLQQFTRSAAQSAASIDQPSQHHAIIIGAINKTKSDLTMPLAIDREPVTESSESRETETEGSDDSVESYGSDGNGQVLRNNVKNLDLQHTVGSDPTSIYSTTGTLGLDNQDEDEDGEPSADTLERLSRRVAMKLSEQVVPGVSRNHESRHSGHYSQTGGGKQPFLQMMKDFKNSIGRIGSNQGRRSQPVRSLFEDGSGGANSNWMLHSTSNNNQLPSKSEPGRGAESSMSEDDGPRSARSTLSRPQKTQRLKLPNDHHKELVAARSLVAPIDHDDGAANGTGSVKLHHSPPPPMAPPPPPPPLPPVSSSTGSSSMSKPGAIVGKHYQRNRVPDRQRKKYHQKIHNVRAAIAQSLTRSSPTAMSRSVDDQSDDAESFLSSGGFESDPGPPPRPKEVFNTTPSRPSDAHDQGDNWSLSSLEVSTTSTMDPVAEPTESELGVSSILSDSDAFTESSIGPSASQRGPTTSHFHRGSQEDLLSDYDGGGGDEEDPNNPIEACLARLASASLDGGNEITALQLPNSDRATKGIAVLQKIKSSPDWRHVCSKRSSLHVQGHHLPPDIASDMSSVIRHPQPTRSLLSDAGDDNASSVTVSSIAFCKTKAYLADMLLHGSSAVRADRDDQQQQQLPPPPKINYANYPSERDQTVQSSSTTHGRTSGTVNYISKKPPPASTSATVAAGEPSGVTRVTEPTAGSAVTLSLLDPHRRHQDQHQPDNSDCIEVWSSDPPRATTNDSSIRTSGTEQPTMVRAISSGNCRQLISGGSGGRIGSIGQDRLSHVTTAQPRKSPNDNCIDGSVSSTVIEIAAAAAVAELIGDASSPTPTAATDHQLMLSNQRSFVTRIPV